MYVCVCKAVTDTQIKRAISAGVSTRRDLFKCLGVGGDCGKCTPQVKELLDDYGQHHTACPNLSQNSANPNPSILAA